MIFQYFRARSIGITVFALLFCGGLPALAALPTVVINSAGSNTAASGAGPATALFGTAAATAASTTVTLLTDNPNLSGVATDGSAVLWVGSSSGRQFSKITGVNNTAGVKTVTVAVAYANTESGKNWGIGGKRATMAGSTSLFDADWALGWVVDVQTGETISSQIRLNPPAADSVTAPCVVTSTTFTTWGTQPLIQTSTNSLQMFNIGAITGLVIENLSFKTTAGTPGVCFGPGSGASSDIAWKNCIFDGFLSSIQGDNATNWTITHMIVDSCEIKNNTVNAGNTAAVTTTVGGSTATVYITNCYFHDNKLALACNTVVAVLEGNVFANNLPTTVIPIRITPANTVVKNNTIYNTGIAATTTDPAIQLSFGGLAGNALIHENNIYHSCPGYGISVASSSEPKTFVNRNNAYGGNNGAGTGLNRLNLAAGAGDVTLAASPFVSTVTPDYGLNATAGGGVLCKGAAATVPNASANPAGDLGAIPSGGGGSAGGGGFRPRPRTSFNLLPETLPMWPRISPAASTKEWRKAG